MVELNISELSKIFVSFIIICVLISLSVLSFQFQDVPQFKQEIHHQIQRTGGLTPEALSTLNKISEQGYNSRFSFPTGNKVVKDENGRDRTVPMNPHLNRKYDFGTPVDYTIKVEFKLPFFNRTVFPVYFSGSSSSQIRLE